MAKSLTETAKEILMNEQNAGFALDKSQHVPSMGTYDKNPERDVNSTTAAKSSLKPGTKHRDPKGQKNDNSKSPDPEGYDDLGGATQKSLPSENLGAKAAKGVSKDSSRSSKALVGPEKSKKLSEDEEIVDEVIEEDSEFDEELGAIIQEMIDSGMTEEEIEMALDEAFAEDDEVLEEDSDIELSEEVEAFIEVMVEEGYSDEEIEEAIAENFELVSEDYDYEDEDYEPIIEREPIDMSEHVNALLEGETLSEDFRNKATTIFESAVNAKIEEEVAILEEAYVKSLSEEVEKVKETLAEQVDDYLNYVVENWISENEVAIEPALKTELTEEFISGLRNLFAEHYISVPDEQVDVMEELGNKIEELETRLSEEIETNVNLKKHLTEAVREEIVAEASHDLSDTQTEKLRSLAEGVEFTSEEEFSRKLQTIKENYFPSKSPTSEPLDPVESDGRGMISENLEGPMAAYVKTLGKKLPK